jgi:O-methyltransferase involved in polyketide biosynthesis
MSDHGINLGSVQETMLLPVWGRAVETQKEHPLLVDATAKRIVDAIGYDFSLIEKNIDPLTRAAWIARSIYFDHEIQAFLTECPEGTILNVGCGLDTTYDRVNNGKATWYELDFPDVIDLRRKFIDENEHRAFIPESVFGKDWPLKIRNKQRVLVMMAGVVYYFDEAGVKSLFKVFARLFGKTDLIFDYCSRKGLEITNKSVLAKGGMNKNACLKWSVENIHELESWDPSIKVLKNMAMFEEHKKNFPPEKHLGMNMSDSMKIMSLAHVAISGS